MRKVFLFIAIIFVYGCHKKSLEIEVVDVECEDFAISDPSYAFVDNACDSIGGDSAIAVTFEYDGEEKCLHTLKTDVHFYDNRGNEIFDVVHNPGDTPIERPVVETNGNDVTFNYCYNVTDEIQENELAYVHMNFNTRSEQGAESNLLGIRVNMPGSTVPEPNENEIASEYEVQSELVELSVFDHAAQDGDIISINVNGVWEIENFAIVSEPQIIQIRVNPGDNFIYFYAVNEGSSPPNTLAGEISDDFKTEEFTLGLKTAESAYFRLTYVQ